MRNTELAASYTKGPDLERKGPSLGATLTGLEPATSAVTGRRANQLRHRAVLSARERTLVDAAVDAQIGPRSPGRALVSAAFEAGRPRSRGGRGGAIVARH